MKKSILICCLLYCFILSYGQAPSYFSYQAVIRDNAGQLVSNGTITMIISILQGSTGGTVVYSEMHHPSTNINGLTTLSIGNGNVISGILDSIDWAQGPYFLKTETDPTGGTSLTITGTSQLLSVPYALYAAKSGTPGPQGIPGPQGMPGPQGIQGPMGTFQNGNNPGDMFYWDGSQWVLIPLGSDGQTLKICNGIPTWGNCVPVVVTDSVVSFDAVYAEISGNVLSDGGSFVFDRGICYGTTPNPTPGQSNHYLRTGLGAFSDSLKNLQPNTTYYFRTYATNSVGTGYGQEYSFHTLLYGVGAPGQAGTIIFDKGVYSNGWQYMEITNSAIANARWECMNFDIPGANNPFIGGGIQNTFDIVTGCPVTGRAGNVCDQYTGGGYNDWFLPSIEELQQASTAIHFGGYINCYRAWTSTELNAVSAATVIISSGQQSAESKSNLVDVLAVRVF